MANDNPSTKTEKTEAPQSGYTWGERVEIALLGGAGTLIGIGAAKGIAELGKQVIGRKVADESTRQAASLGRRLTGLFSR